MDDGDAALSIVAYIITQQGNDAFVSMLAAREVGLSFVTGQENNRAEDWFGKENAVAESKANYVRTRCKDLYEYKVSKLTTALSCLHAPSMSQLKSSMSS